MIYVAGSMFRVLPKTNCKECGEANCFAFAAKIVLQGQQRLENCKPLFTPEYADARETITEVLTAIM